MLDSLGETNQINIHISRFFLVPKQAVWHFFSWPKFAVLPVVGVVVVVRVLASLILVMAAALLLIVLSVVRLLLLPVAAVE